jgi:HEAT repeat protein
MKRVSKPGPALRSGVFLAALVHIAALLPAVGLAQTVGAPGLSARARQDSTLADGWQALSRGDLPRAVAAAEGALVADPRDPSALALAVEVALRRGGTSAGLDRYERWLSERGVEDFYVVRRLAIEASLDVLSLPQYPGLRQEAATALSAAGRHDEVLSRLQEQAKISAGADLATLAAMGDRNAVASLAADLAAGRGQPLTLIAALTASRSSAAIPALVGALSSSRAEVRVAAAKGLGDIDAKAAIPRLREMLGDPMLLPRMAAVEGLMHLGDRSGAELLQTWFSSDVADIRLKAAEASASEPDAAWLSRVHQLLQDPDPVVRIGAARLLADHDPEGARSVLQALTGDANLAIREEAARTLPAVIGGDFGELRRYLHAGDAVIRTRAALRILELVR